MVKKICILIITLMLVVHISAVGMVSALNTGFETNQLSAKEKGTFLSNVNLELVEAEPKKDSIQCFDVNNNGLIAIGQNSSNRKIICIYSTDGDFQYGYTFDCTGDFGVEWDNDNLNIYFVRSAILVSVAPSGEILDALEVQNTIDNNSYVNHFIHATERTVNSAKYSIGNDMGILNFFATAYSQLTVKDMTGMEKVIYDISTVQLFNTITTIIFSLVLFSAAILIIIKGTIKRKTSEGTMS